MANYARMKELVEFLNYHQNLYDKGTPVISDKEWDDAYFELKHLEGITGESLPGSPTQKVQYEVVTELKKVKHEYQPMLSLDKTKDIEEIKSFIGNKDWIAMLKLDGLTCRLTYEEGKLVRAETRGDGVEGEDITHNALVLSSIPKRIDYYDTLVVDGEVICDKTTFEQFKDEYANARNFAAGSIRLLDSKECAKRGLTFVAWDLIIGRDTKDISLTRCLEKLIDLGFNAVYWSSTGGSTIEDSIEELQADNNKYDNYPIDGIVFKWNIINEYLDAGRTEHHFRGGLAYKFYDEEYETRLIDIEWSMGRTGVLTPVAVYEDIAINGAICNRANLHNISIMTNTLGSLPHWGQRIWVAKMNQIIPQVVRADKNDNSLLSGLFEIPSVCPICHGEVEVYESDSGTQELYCTNPQCPGKLVNKLDHFAGKKGLDIKGLSKATLEKLIDWGWVTRIMDLFYLHQRRREWVEKPGFGVKSVDKVLDAIETARHTTLEKYLSAISIPLIGKTYSRELAQTFGDYESFKDAVVNYFDFETLEGFGPAMHDAITTFDYTEADLMVERYIIDFVKDNVQEENKDSSLNGAIVCVTGKLKNFKNRDDFKTLLERFGAKVTTSVSSKTTYLVNNDINSTSSKNKTAKELGIPILTEQEILDMLN